MCDPKQEMKGVAAMMRSRHAILALSRRAILSTLAAFPMLLAVPALAQTAATDPLPSWNDTAAEEAIVTFVERVTKQGSPDIVPPAERMVERAKGGGGVRFALLVHQTDAEREWAYDRKSSIRQLDAALDVAQAEGWTVVDLKNNWNTIFPFGSK